MEVRGSPDRLRAATGWEPEIPLERTLADTVAWWREQIRAGVYGSRPVGSSGRRSSRSPSAQPGRVVLVRHQRIARLELQAREALRLLGGRPEPLRRPGHRLQRSCTP